MKRYRFPWLHLHLQWRIRRSGLFCKTYYERQAGRRFRSLGRAIRHCLRAPHASPHPLFDPAYYLEQNPDVAITVTHPFVHFIRYGYREFRNPHPLFDVFHYCSQSTTNMLSLIDSNPLAHYCQASRIYSAANPSPLFSTREYLHENPEAIRSNTPPLVHYVLSENQDLDAHDKVTVGAETEGAWRPDGISALLQVRRDIQTILHWGLFRMDHYQRACGKRFESVRSAVAHYVRGGWRSFSPNPLFDGSYYVREYPDIADAGINPLVHYIRHGHKELRNPHPGFQIADYARQCPDLAKSGEDPLQHYLRNAFHPDCPDPSVFLHKARHLGENPDLARDKKVTPLEDWITKGCPSPHQDNDAFADSAGRWNGDVILVSHEASRTGAPLVVLHIAKRLKEEHGMRCLILLEQGGELLDEFRRYGDVVVLDHRWEVACYGPAGIADLLAEHVSERPKYVFVNSAESYKVMRALALLDWTFILLIHEFASCYPQSFIRPILTLPNAIVFPSECVRLEAKTAQPRLPESTIRPQGFFSDIPEIDRTEARRRLREQWNIPQHHSLVLGCGTINRRKGVDLFLRTAEAFYQRRTGAAVSFVWIGDADPHEAQFSTDIEESRLSMGLGNQVHFVGRRKDIDTCFAAADLFFLSSRADPFPCVVLHAMAAGVPVVCFDRSTGAADLFQDGQAGRVAEHLSPGSAAAIMADLLADPNRGTTMGRAGRQMVRERFQYNEYVRDLLAIHDENVSTVETADRAPEQNDRA